MLVKLLCWLVPQDLRRELKVGHVSLCSIRGLKSLEASMCCHVPRVPEITFFFAVLPEHTVWVKHRGTATYKAQFFPYGIYTKPVLRNQVLATAAICIYGFFLEITLLA